MRLSQTPHRMPLASVKPLEAISTCRDDGLTVTRQAVQRSGRRRARCPADGATLEPWGDIEGITYARCPEGGGAFLASLPEPSDWADVVARVNQHRHAAQGLQADLVRSRTDHVYAPRLEWIQSTLRLHELRRPALLEVITAPSDLTELLRQSGLFSGVLMGDESRMAREPGSSEEPLVQAAVLPESLDRSHDPAALLTGVRCRLSEEGLLFITSLVCSGFDFAVLGLRNRYLYPPDRTNCFSLQELEALVTDAGFTLVEVSTPGVLDLEIVRVHAELDPALSLSAFERHLIRGDAETQEAFQAFLQQRRLSSFTRMVARKRG